MGAAAPDVLLVLGVLLRLEGHLQSSAAAWPLQSPRAACGRSGHYLPTYHLPLCLAPCLDVHSLHASLSNHCRPVFSTAFLGPPFQGSGLALSGGVVGNEERAELTLWDIGALLISVYCATAACASHFSG